MAHEHELTFDIHVLQHHLQFFLPAWLPDDTKEKVVNACRTEFTKSQCYDIQLRAIATCKQIENSQILGVNEVVVPILIKEYAELYLCCVAIQKQIAAMKKYLPIERVTDGIKLSAISSWMYDDLCHIHATFGTDIQIANCMRWFKLLIDVDINALLKTNWQQKGFLQHIPPHAPLVQI